MDWLDTYLDGLAQYKTTVSPCDTHIWGEKPNLNNQQKRMLFDAAAQSELEYRLIVQESRQAEIDAGMGGSYDAGSAARERPATPATPSGIPVASTASVVISGNATFNGIAVKKVASEQCFGDPVFGGKLFVDTGVVYAYGLSENAGKVLIPPQALITDTYETGKLSTPSATWRLVDAAYDGGEDTYYIISTANNSSTDANYIPTSGWSPSITIIENTFPASITLTFTNNTNLAPNTLVPITNLNQLDENSEIPSLADQSFPYRIYLSTASNSVEFPTIDYKYVIYLANSTAGYYTEAISAGRWLIGCGSNFQGDNTGYYVNFGYYTELQSKTTPPSSNIANWTRLNGYFPNSGTLTGITFNF